MIKTTIQIFCDGCGEEVDQTTQFISLNINGNQVHLHDYSHMAAYGDRRAKEEKEKTAASEKAQADQAAIAAEVIQ